MSEWEFGGRQYGKTNTLNHMLKLQERITILEAKLAIAVEALELYSKSINPTKEWCSMSDGNSTKWYHSVASCLPAREALEQIRGEK